MYINKHTCGMLNHILFLLCLFDKNVLLLTVYAKSIVSAKTQEMKTEKEKEAGSHLYILCH